MHARTPLLTTRLFLGWQHSAVELVAARLLNVATPSAKEPPLIVVPTKEAARLLKEQLALQSSAGSTQGACLSPRIIPSNQLLQLCNTPLPSPVEKIFCWQETLLSASPALLRELFQSSDTWSEQSWLYQAQQLHELMDTLERDGIASHDERLLNLAEQEYRWKCLLTLQAQQHARLCKLGYSPDSSAHTLDLPPATPIILACVPQLSLQLQQLLSTCGHPVEAWIHAPESRQACFDAWGCPTGDWLHPAPCEQTGLSAEQWREHLVLCPDSWTLAEQAVLRLGQLHAQEQARLHSVALCNADPETEASLDETLALRGVTVHRPRGRSFRGSAWYQLISQLSQLQEQLSRGRISLGKYAYYPSSIILELINNPLVGRYLHGEQLARRGEAQAYLLSRIQSRSFPTQLGGMIKELKDWAQFYPREARLAASAGELLHALEKLCIWLTTALRSGSALIEQLSQWCDSVLQTPSPARPSTADSLHRGYSQTTATLCEQLQALLPQRALSAQSVLYYLQLLGSSQRATPARSDDASLDIMGWRDLPYSAARQLVITSLHDGVVPERWSVQAWLTPSVREQLGLRSDTEHAAHDAYLLQSILAPRVGRVYFYLSLLNGAGDPLAPSSLLFKLTPRDQLAALVSYLFSHQEVTAPSNSSASSDAPSHWQYRQLANPQQLPLDAEHLAHARLSDFGQEHPIKPTRGYSPALLKSFLACPLRFWLREIHQLDPQTQEGKKRQLNAADQGNILHEALEHFVHRYPDYASYHAAHPTLPAQPEQLDDKHTADLEQLLLDILQGCYESSYPSDALLPQQLQYSSMQRQLASYAAIHIQLWREGWSTARDTQGKLLIEYRPDWDWDGYKMNFKIDRVDWREGPAGLEMRVLDYKTGLVDSCAKKHLTPLHEERGELPPRLLSPAFMPAHSKKKLRPQRWTDLQLPLYAAWVEEAYSPALISAGYIRLSREAADSALVLWEDTRDYSGLFDEYSLDGEEGDDATTETQQLFDNAKAWIRGSMELIASGRCLVSAELMGWSVAYDSLFAPISAQAPLHEIFIESPTSNSSDTPTL